MVDRGSGQILLFEVLTPLSFSVRVTSSNWELITKIKHPVMAGRESIVKETLRSPAHIRLSRSDASVYLFYRQERADRWICAVAKRLGNEGFLITAYPTEVKKEGVQVWPR